MSYISPRWVVTMLASRSNKNCITQRHKRSGFFAELRSLD